jgi:hypothetical protein
LIRSGKPRRFKHAAGIITAGSNLFRPALARRRSGMLSGAHE